MCFELGKGMTIDGVKKSVVKKSSSLIYAESRHRTLTGIIDKYFLGLRLPFNSLSEYYAVNYLRKD